MPDVDVSYHFPPGFLWGTSTSAYQVEGSNDNNDWWVWEQDGKRRSAGHIFHNQTSGRACEWWAGRAEEDIVRMAELNTNAHRLSIEWSRIEPKPGVWDEDAMVRYREILTAMRGAGIKPMVTLHHFTIPIWMSERGGWLNHESREWFRRFTEKVVTGLGDLCDLWCTINEPNVYAAHGFFKGTSPPHRQSLSEYFSVVYHLLLAHATAYQTIHRIQPQAQVGLAKHLIMWRARHALNPVDGLITHLLVRGFNSVTLDALATGRWRPVVGRRASVPELKGALDWIGINYYQRYEAGFSLHAHSRMGMLFTARPTLEKGPDWWGELWPDGLYVHLKRVYQKLQVPVYITENGVPDHDDVHRPHFILDHLRRVWQTLRDGVPVKGYYFWSLLDNFEWTEGYNPRFNFGLYAVDWDTQARTPRNSASLYGEIARTGTISSEMARRYAPQSLESLLPSEWVEGLEEYGTRLIFRPEPD